MVWQKIDDQFGVSKKVIRIPRARRQQCVGLWLLGLNYAGRSLTDGLLEEHELDELGARAADVAELIRVDLWHGPGHACERCADVPAGAVIVHDFLVYNPSREKVEADREAERVRKASQRDKRRTPDGTSGGVRDVSEHPDPVPVPDPLTGLSEEGQAGTTSATPSPFCPVHMPLGPNGHKCAACADARRAWEAAGRPPIPKATLVGASRADPADCKHSAAIRLHQDYCGRCESRLVDGRWVA